METYRRNFDSIDVNGVKNNIEKDTFIDIYKDRDMVLGFRDSDSNNIRFCIVKLDNRFTDNQMFKISDSRDKERCERQSGILRTYYEFIGKETEGGILESQDLEIKSYGKFGSGYLFVSSNNKLSRTFVSQDSFYDKIEKRFSNPIIIEPVNTQEIMGYDVYGFLNLDNMNCIVIMKSNQHNESYPRYKFFVPNDGKTFELKEAFRIKCDKLERFRIRNESMKNNLFHSAVYEIEIMYSQVSDHRIYQIVFKFPDRSKPGLKTLNGTIMESFVK